MIGRRTFLGMGAGFASRRGLRIATFASDVTPPVGSPLCYGLVPDGSAVTDPLQARGVVLLPEGQRPIVLCAVDWLGIANGSRDRWRAALAQSCGTTPDRVAVHTVHQHDAPGDDFHAQALLPPGLSLYDERFAAVATRRTAEAAALAKPVSVTHVGTGSARVDKIASNRRILGPDGKVVFGRMTACRANENCDAPEGVIDPVMRSISFFKNESRVATLSYYATHPMSYYGKGAISADFVGLARARQADTFQVHFTGAAGNIGAGKYNDGSPRMRPILADRMAKAMADAKAAEQRQPVDAVQWRSIPVAMPLRTGTGFSESDMVAAIADATLDPRQRRNNARYLAFYRLTKAGRTIDLSSLQIGQAKILHMPGELFVEYQLAAKVAMAAYGDYAPMYIGTQSAYAEGGYETSAVSRVSPDVEGILRTAMEKLL